MHSTKGNFAENAGIILCMRPANERWRYIVWIKKISACYELL